MGAWYRTGTVDVTNGDAAIVGTATLWSSQVNVGDLFIGPDLEIYEITVVTDDTHASIKQLDGTAYYAGTTQSAQPYAIIRNFTDTTNADLAARVAALLQKWQARQDELADWQAGTATGGPGSDGKYPLTNALGVEELIYCPAWVLDQLSDYYTQTESDARYPLFGDVQNSNVLINGDFKVWQRGANFNNNTVSGKAYLADRWSTFWYTGVSDRAVFPASGDKHRYCLTYQRNQGATSVDPIWLVQSLEINDSIPLAGGPVTISFRVRVGGNFSSGSGLLYVGIDTGTGVDEDWTSPLTGYAGAEDTITPTTSWGDYSVTLSVPAGVSQVVLKIWYVPTGAAGYADWFQVEGVKLERGDRATLFESRSYAQELALCQRYFQKPWQGRGVAFDSSTLICDISLAGKMRAIPTLTLLTSSAYFECPWSNIVAPTSPTTQTHASSSGIFRAKVTGFSGLTVDKDGEWRDAFTLDAEL